VLNSIGAGVEHKALVERLMRCNNLWLRLWAARQAGRPPLSDSDFSEQVDALLSDLQSRHILLQYRAAQLLRELGPAHAKAAAPHLRTIVRSESRDTLKVIAARALVRLDHEAIDLALPVLLDRLRDDDKYVSAAAVGLVEVGQVAPGRLASLIADGESKIRPDIAWALSWGGADAAEAIPILRSSLVDTDPRVRVWSAFALAFLTDDNMTARLTKTAAHGDDNVRAAARRALEAISRGKAQRRKASRWNLTREMKLDFVRWRAAFE
jgi:HEAT repeat protein